MEMPDWWDATVMKAVDRDEALVLVTLLGVPVWYNIVGTARSIPEEICAPSSTGAHAPFTPNAELKDYYFTKPWFTRWQAPEAHVLFYVKKGEDDA